MIWLILLLVYLLCAALVTMFIVILYPQKQFQEDFIQLSIFVVLWPFSFSVIFLYLAISIIVDRMKKL